MANKVHTFPSVMSGKVLCRVCKKGATGMVVVERGTHKTKYLLPCQHRLSEIHEEIIVRDMLRKGL